jgi:hypothetical protein
MGDTQRPQSAVTSTGTEAAAELARIQQLQEQVIKTVLVPVWYWWVMGAGMVTIGAARDSHDPLVLAIAIPIAVLVMVGLTAWMIPECRRRVRLHSTNQPGPGATQALFALIVLVNVVTILTCVYLSGTQVSSPLTIGYAAGAAVLVIGGPLLNAYVRKVRMGNVRHDVNLAPGSDDTA